MNRGSLVLLLGAALASPAIADDYYKWKDDNGVWHYTKEAPKGREASAVKVVGGGAVPAPGSEPVVEATEPDAAREDGAPRAAGPAEEIKPKLDAALEAKKRNCDAARVNAATLESYTQVSLDRDGDGAPETLSEAEHAAELERARKQIASFCE